MQQLTREQVYHILQNLSNLEIAYTEYTKRHVNYEEYQTYFEYFNNYVIRNHNLIRFYFPLPFVKDTKLPKTITEIDIVPENHSFLPEHDIAMTKMFNFPNATRHQCKYYSLLYLMDGTGELILDEQQFLLKEGDFYLIPDGVYYACVMKPESIGICFNLRCSYLGAEYRNVFQEDPRLNDFFIESLKPDSTMTYLAIHTDNSPVIRNRVLEIFTEYINNDKYSNSAMKNYLALLVTSILRNPKTQIDSSVAIGYIEQQYQLIFDYVKQYYQTASLSEIAEQLHFSKQYICKIVKTVSGKTFQALLMERRLSIVREYLAETSFSLETISELCGFSTAAHLSRSFKNAYGLPPSAFREAHRSRKETGGSLS